MKNPVKKPSWWDEFAAFAIKGNAMALAVGTIIGAAFSTITKSLTDDNHALLIFIHPVDQIIIITVIDVQSLITGYHTHFRERIYSELKQWFGNRNIDMHRPFSMMIRLQQSFIHQAIAIPFIFFSAVINFLILALVVFFLVKSLNKLTELGKKKEEAAPAEPPKPSNEELLLTEIRDLLKEQK